MQDILNRLPCFSSMLYKSYGVQSHWVNLKPPGWKRPVSKSISDKTIPTKLCLCGQIVKIDNCYFWLVTLKSDIWGPAAKDAFCLHWVVVMNVILCVGEVMWCFLSHSFYRISFILWGEGWLIQSHLLFWNDTESKGVRWKEKMN